MLHGIRGKTHRGLGSGESVNKQTYSFTIMSFFFRKIRPGFGLSPAGVALAARHGLPLSLQCDEAPLPQRAQRGGHLVGRRVECLGDVGHLRAVGQLERRKLELVAQLDPRLLTSAGCERSRRPHCRPWSGARAPLEAPLESGVNVSAAAASPSAASHSPAAPSAHSSPPPSGGDRSCTEIVSPDSRAPILETKRRTPGRRVARSPPARSVAP